MKIWILIRRLKSSDAAAVGKEGVARGCRENYNKFWVKLFIKGNNSLFWDFVFLFV